MYCPVEDYPRTVGDFERRFASVDTCRAYLEDFARIASTTYVLTRVRSDFDLNVLDLIDQTQLFDPSDCIEVDHDPATHQLRVLSQQSFDAVRRLDDGGHYELVLRTR